MNNKLERGKTCDVCISMSQCAGEPCARKLKTEVEFMKEQLRRQEEEFEPMMQRKDKRIEQLEKENESLRESLDNRNEWIAEHKLSEIQEIIGKDKLIESLQKRIKELGENDKDIIESKVATRLEVLTAHKDKEIIRVSADNLELDEYCEKLKAENEELRNLQQLRFYYCCECGGIDDNSSKYFIQENQSLRERVKELERELDSARANFDLIQSAEGFVTSVTAENTHLREQAEKLRRLINDDSFAITFQSMKQYREALLKAVSEGENK